MRRFLEAVTPARARELLGGFAALGAEEIDAAAARGRVAASAVVAPAPFPPFDRAVMDGYAVIAADTFGAGEAQPAYLSLAGRAAMGEVWPSPVQRGTCVEISTGGALPAGADAVVMVEHTREAGATTRAAEGAPVSVSAHLPRAAGGAPVSVSAHLVEVQRAAAPGEHVIRAGDDCASGAPLFPAGRRIGPREMAALAAFGIARVAVHRRPRVAVLSTGDELVAAWDRDCPPGKVRDVNGPALAAQIAEVGGEPRDAGCVRDEREAMRAAIASALQVGADLVVVSGGSSQGARDLTAAVLDGFGPPGVLAHGIAVGPGKPTIIAGAAGPRCLVPLIGMPGHPVSSLVIFRLFVGPLVRRLGGESPPADPFPARRRAVLARNVASKPGREDYVRVRVTESEHGMARAEPLLGGTAALSTVLLADGLVRIPLEREGLAAGEEVEVLLW